MLRNRDALLSHAEELIRKARTAEPAVTTVVLDPTVDAVLLLQDLRPHDKLVLLSIARFPDDYVKVRCAKFALNERSYHRSVKLLKERGYLADKGDPR